MSIETNEKSIIKRFEANVDYEEYRHEDIIIDHIDDHHVRIQKLFPFCKRKIIPNLASHNRFHLRFYIPFDIFQDKSRKITKCFFLFNGLDEIVNFSLYDQIGKGLCEKGYGAILFPLPEHLNRNPEYRYNDKSKRRRPSEVFIYSPQMIYFGYLKLIDEVEELINHLTGNCSIKASDYCCQFYSQLFDPQVKISLLGYSLGGLAALSNFLLQKFEFNTCILLNSGANLDDIDVSEFQSHKKWRQTVEKLRQAHYSRHERDVFHRIFDMTFLGNNISLLKNELKDRCRRILFILGGADSVTKFKSIRQIEPKNHGLAMLKLPGIHHFLSIDTQWDKWFPIVNETIALFDESARNESLHPKDILGHLVDFQIKYRFSDRLDHFDLNRISNTDERDTLARILLVAKGTYGNVRKALSEMYKLIAKVQKRPHLYPYYDVEQFENLFGTIASKHFKIKMTVISKALETQEKISHSGKETPFIGEILMDKNILDSNQVAQILKHQSSSKL